jgi:hypothetical protein
MWVVCTIATAELRRDGDGKERSEKQHDCIYRKDKRFVARFLSLVVPESML